MSGLAITVLSMMLLSPLSASDAATHTTSTPGPELQMLLSQQAQKITAQWARSPIKPNSWCDFECTSACDGQKYSCQAAGNDPGYCLQEWELCLCQNQCCTRGSCP